MGIEYYAFALFISALICLIAILCKVLFSNVRRQGKLLDEKETKLLQLYQTVESIMEEFNDQVKAATEEIKEYESRAAARAASIFAQQPVPPVQQPQPAAAAAMRLEQQDKIPRAQHVDSSRLRAANEILARAERIVRSDTLKPSAAAAKSGNGVVFQKLFDETVSEQQAAVTEVPAQQSRNEAILALAREGKSDAQIASELGITRNEVKLVIDLTGRKAK